MGFEMARITSPRTMSPMTRRKLSGAIVLILLILLFIDGLRLLYNSAQRGDKTDSDGSKIVSSPESFQPSHFPETKPLPIPADYNFVRPQSDFCHDRFTVQYFDILRQSQKQYCSDKSSSTLTCFYTPRDFHSDGHRDALCIGQNGRFNAPTRKFTFDCPPPVRDEESTVPFSEIMHEYWYQTGPKYIFNHFVDLQSHGNSGSKHLETTKRSFTYLLKREGAGNLFHCIHEMLSMTYTFDVLRSARDPRTGEAFFVSPEDELNTQVIILDDSPDGPYFDLWRLFSRKIPKRLQELVEEGEGGWLSKPLENVIIPLAGAGNPMWQDNWEHWDCINELRRTFVRRILDFYDIPHDDDPRPAPGKVLSTELKLTFIDRKETRRLKDTEALLDATRLKFPNVHVQAVDLAGLPFKEQIQIARETDILVGVHGAGLTHVMFMKEGKGAVVEILPDTFDWNGCRAMARERNLRYYKTHTKSTESKGDWHREDLEIDEDRFLDLMDHAIKSLYNREGWFKDLN